MQNLSLELENVQSSVKNLKKKLSAANLGLASTMDKENSLRNQNESLVLEEAQVRYELDQLKKQLSEKLQERDLAHSERVQLLEKVSLKTLPGLMI